MYVELHFRQVEVVSLVAVGVLIYIYQTTFDKPSYDFGYVVEI